VARVVHSVVVRSSQATPADAMDNSPLEAFGLSRTLDFLITLLDG
jgi:hypothetical protein